MAREGTGFNGCGFIRELAADELPVAPPPSPPANPTIPTLLFPPKDHKR